MTDLPNDERQRLQALERYDILDTSSEQAFDRISRLVARVLDVPIATVTFLDAHRLWFKSKLGLTERELPREEAFCDHAVRSAEMLVIPDALADARFAGHACVSGEPRIRFYAGVPLVTPDRWVIGTLCAMDTRPRTPTAEEIETLRDFAAITMDALELRRLALLDGLTGALTRKGFREEAAKAVSLALRHQHDLTAIAFDLDHFKAVNDTYGHAAGDRVLHDVVAACREVLRITDLIGRVGGEEFTVILPHTPRKHALSVAEKLRAAIAALPFEAAGKSFSVTASFGVASLDRQMGNVEALLERADGVLYGAKAAGRNRVLAWEQPEVEKPTIRRRVLKAGRISFNDKRSSIDCTVRTLSDKEAGLDVIASAGLPAKFDLVIDADRFVRGCHVIAQTERHIEVAFD